MITPVGAEYCVTLCDLGVFVNQAAEPVASEDARARWQRGDTAARQVGCGAASGSADAYVVIDASAARYLT